MVAKFNADGVFDSGVPVKTVMGAPAATDVLAGFLSHAATTAAAALITVPAGRTWTGTISVAAAASTAAGVAAAGQARAVVTTAGVGAIPAGTLMAAEARSAANAATGTSGDSNSTALSVPVVVVAPAGNAVTVQVASTITTGVVDVSASGMLV